MNMVLRGDVRKHAQTIFCEIEAFTLFRGTGT